MKIRNTFYFLTLTSFMCSCANFKSARLYEGQIELKTNNLELLNGTYCLDPSNEVKKRDLFWYYSGSIFTKDRDGKKNFYYVNLQKIGQQQLKLTFLDGNDNVLKSRTITGRIKNGHFTTNGKVIIIPFIIVNALGTEKIRIGLLENSNLILDYKRSVFGNIFIYPVGGVIDERNVEYIRMD